MITLKSPAQIAKMRAAGRIVHQVLKQTGEAVQPGVTTGELEDLAARIISENGGTSPFLGYTPSGHAPFPAWTCISVNEEIVHGIPGRRRLMEGDIVTIDCGVELDGWIGDSAWTFGVGKISPQADRLLKTTEEALYKGIDKARAGNRTGDIGHAVQAYAENHGFSVVRELTGPSAKAPQSLFAPRSMNRLPAVTTVSPARSPPVTSTVPLPTCPVVI